MVNYNLVKYSTIQFEMPFAIDLPDDNYSIYYDKIYAHINIRRNTVTDKLRIPNDVRIAETMFIIGDKWGKFNTTIITIRFYHYIYIKWHVLLRDFLILLSVKLINRLLDICRDVKGDYYIRITPSDIYSYTISHINLLGQEVGGGGFSMGGNNTTTFGVTVKKEHLDLIKKLLQTDSKLPLFQELLFNAWDYYFYGNYKLSVIESETAFEVFIKHLVYKKYKECGKPDLYINKVLERSFKNILIDHIPSIINYNFYNSKEYTKWNENVYEIRNEIIHEGKDVSSDMAKISVETVPDTIRFILSLNS